jgi:hypothetical protein
VSLLAAAPLLALSLGATASTGGSASHPTEVPIRAQRTAKAKIELCVRSWGESRYRSYGYDHIVHVANGCEQAVVCGASTDVDPRPITRTVAPKGHVAVMTRRASPTRKFEVRVVCQFVAGA